MTEGTALRMGSTTILDCDRIPDVVLERAFKEYRAYVADRTRHDEATLRARCSDCNELGMLGFAPDAYACHHRSAFLAIYAERAGLTVLVRKPREVVVQS